MLGNRVWHEVGVKEDDKKNAKGNIPARSTSLDLTSAETDNDISNGVILSLTGTVRDHDTPSRLLGEDGSLVDQEKEREKVSFELLRG